MTDAAIPTRWAGRILKAIPRGRIPELKHVYAVKNGTLKVASGTLSPIGFDTMVDETADAPFSLTGSSDFALEFSEPGLYVVCMTCQFYLLFGNAGDAAWAQLEHDKQDGSGFVLVTGTDWIINFEKSSGNTLFAGVHEVRAAAGDKIRWRFNRSSGFGTIYSLTNDAKLVVMGPWA